MKKILAFCGLLALLVFVPTRETQAQCARCNITNNFVEEGVSCQHGPLQDPEADDCHMNDKGGCVLVGIPCGGAFAVSAKALGSEFLTTVDGTPAGLMTESRMLADGRRVFENCRGLIVHVEYDAKKEAKVRVTVDHIVV